MSVAYFSAIVQVVTTEIRIGLNRDQEYTNYGVIHLSGRLDEFKAAEGKVLLINEKTIQVDAELYFTDDFNMHSGHDLNGKKYIGEILIIKGDKSKLFCDVKVDIPFPMFRMISSMRGNDIRLESVQDLIEPHTRDYETVGRVSEVFFKSW